MDIAITILSILHVFVALLLILIVMWQKPRQEGLGTSFGGGMSEQMFGAQATNVLQKGTVWISIIFFANTIVIAVLMARQTNANRASSLLTETAPPPAETAPAGTAPTAPTSPGAPSPTSPGAPVESPAPAPVAPAPAIPETPAPVIPETQAPAAPESPASETPETPTPETPAPASEAPAAPEPAPAPANTPE